MYKCLDCGHIFEEGEQAVSREYHDEIPGGFHEDFEACPICGGGFEETCHCQKCGGEFLYDELIEGYFCEDCLRELLTEKTFHDFATSNVKSSSEVDILEDFVIREILEVDGPSEILTCSSWALKNFISNIFRETVATDNLSKRFSGRGELIEKIRRYMDVWNLWDGFAEYMHEKGVRT